MHKFQPKNQIFRGEQNMKLDKLFSKLSNDKINITNINTPTKNIYEEKSFKRSHERKQTKERKNCKEISRSNYTR